MKIEPYYERDGQVIYNSDCLTLMKTFPDKSFDLVLTDPLWKIDYDRYLVEFFRLLKDNGSIVMFVFPDDIWAIHKYPKQILVWEEVYSPQGRHTKKYRRFFDFIVWWTKSENYTFNNLTRYQLRGVFNDYFEDFDEKKHPYQKPLSLIKKLVKIHSNKNDLILDPFLGSGTTLVAAKYLNRKAVGIEISEQYCKIAKDRLAQIKLF